MSSVLFFSDVTLLSPSQSQGAGRYCQSQPWSSFTEKCVLVAMVTAVSIFESKNLLLFQSSGMYQSDTVMSCVLAWKYSVISMVDDMVVDGSFNVLVVCVLFFIVDRPKNSHS